MVLGLIQTLHLFVPCDAETHGGLEHNEQDQRPDSGNGQSRAGGNQLGIEQFAPFEQAQLVVSVVDVKRRSGGENSSQNRAQRSTNAMNAERNWILAIGGIAIRRRVLEEIALIEKSTSAQATYVALTLVHPTAYVSPTAEIGQGVYIGPKAVVHAFANVGNHAIINSGAIVEHECVIGENSHIAPGAVLGGNVRVGRDTLVGIGSRVLPGIQVGAGATVGGGATVVRTVVAGSTVVGVPARTR